MGWVFPSVVALATSVVSASEQGASAGIVSAMQGLGVDVGPVIATAVHAIDPGVPFVMIAIALLGGVTGSAGSRRARDDQP